MSNQEQLLQKLLELLGEGRKCALCSVIARSGSVPAPAGGRLLVLGDGTIAGTVGGGPLEGEVREIARQAIADDRPAVKNFDFGGEAMAESLQICGGRISVYTEVIYPTGLEREVFGAVRDCLAAGNSVGLATAVLDDYAEKPPTAHRLAFDTDGAIAGSLSRPGWNARVIEELEPLFYGEDPVYLQVEDGPREYGSLRGLLVEFFHPAPELVVFGGGHIGRPLARLAALCGFRVTVADDRAEYADPQRFPEADRTVSAEYPAMFEQLEIGPRHYLVSVTRCHNTDLQVVERALTTSAAYIGMIGSRRKVKLIRRELENRGLDSGAFQRVHAPVGVDIGAETPEEIAVSIIAQVISARRGGKPQIQQRTIALPS